MTVPVLGSVVTSMVLTLLGMASSWSGFAFADEGSYDLIIDDRIFTIKYDSPTDAQVSRVSQNGMSLAVEVEGMAHDGAFTLTFPRDLLDQVFTGHWISVFADEIDEQYEIVELSCDEVAIQFYLEAGTEEIEFAGADLPAIHVHPEPQIFQPPVRIKAAEQNFDLSVESGSRICGYALDTDTKQIHFDLARATTQNTGNFSIIIPHNMLGGNYTVLADGMEVPHSEEFISASNIFPASAHDRTRISFEYDTRVKSVDIIGQTAVPEFGSLAIPIVALSAASLVVVISGKAWRRASS